ncbi:allantoinase AllB [Aureispira]|nr:allantoinase AllB [Aureispira sp.]
MNTKIAIYSSKVLLPNDLGSYTIYIDNGQIVDIEIGKSQKPEYIFHDYGDYVLMPGIIDPHVHINEPGRADWEGFDTGTTAAVAGGVTTLVDMPLNSTPVTINVKEFNKKIEVANKKAHIHCGFWGGIIPANISQLIPLAQAGILGFKAFLIHSGIDEFPDSDEETLIAAYNTLKGSNLPILAHCEIGSATNSSDLDKYPSSYMAYLKSRPKKWENDAIELMLKLAEEFNHPTHIVHISSADCLDSILAAKKGGVPITVETCPHYLFFNAENIPNADTRFKCAPPIRGSKNNDLLWESLINGTIDFIGSDHSPAPPNIKELDSGNLRDAWGGISGIQFTLSALWTKGVKYGLTLQRLKEILCESPAKFIGQELNKGKIKVGYDADLVIWDPNETFKVVPEIIQARHKISPYSQLHLKGRVKYTYVKGNLVWNGKELIKKQEGTLIIGV